MFSTILHKKRVITIFRHVASWLVIFSLPYFLRLIYEMDVQPSEESKGFMYLSFCTNFLWVITFYLNTFYFIPYLANKKRWFLYILATSALYSFLLGLHGLFFHHFFPYKHFNISLSALFNLPAYLLSLACSTIFKLVEEKRQSQILEQKKQQENLRTELLFLRSQISPHFIFNILNNIVALARLKSDKLEPTVLKLSSLMQYMLYDTNEDRVLVRTEVDYLQSYIDLQKQRFGDHVKVITRIDAKDDFCEIEPMLLIPFVENAFKHGVGLVENPEIVIELTVADKLLNFGVKNYFTNAIVETKDKASGIGLNNVKRRLKLLYKDQHRIEISRTEAGENKLSFEVHLQINLH